jgi:hypothetical protein
MRVSACRRPAGRPGRRPSRPHHHPRRCRPGCHPGRARRPTPAEQAAQDVAEAAPAALGALPATAERLGEEGQHEWRQDRQRLLEDRVEPAALAIAEAAGRVDDLVLVVAEDVADDLGAVVGVHLAKVRTALDQARVVLRDCFLERRRAPRVLGVGLHPAGEHGAGRPGRLRRSLLARSARTRLRPGDSFSPPLGLRVGGRFASQDETAASLRLGAPQTPPPHSRLAGGAKPGPLGEPEP